MFLPKHVILVWQKHLAHKSLRTMYELLELGRPISIRIDLFNKMVKPILLYGSEVIRCGNNDVLGRVHLKSVKFF